MITNSIFLTLHEEFMNGYMGETILFSGVSQYWRRLFYPSAPSFECTIEADWETKVLEWIFEKMSKISWVTYLEILPYKLVRISNSCEE